VILRVESREEILVDKWIALAYRPNRVQYRDLWDILWLSRQRVSLNVSLLNRKVIDRGRQMRGFFDAIDGRLEQLREIPAHAESFRKEMERFLPAGVVRDTVEQPAFQTVLIQLLQDQRSSMK